MFRGVDHIAIASPDPEALAQWYVERLGFAVSYRLGGRAFLEGADGSMLEITPSEGPRIARPHASPGLRHLGVAVDDLDAACRRLQGQGVEFFSPPRIQDGFRLVFFDDPDGNILHLIERPPRDRKIGNAPDGERV